MGTLMIIPPSQASSIWPAAGIALAALVTYGKRVIPGIWVGALLTHVVAFFDFAHHQHFFTSLLIGCFASTAATAQAALGAWLIKRHIGVDNALMDDRSILRFFALGGLVSCIISASVGVTTLYLENIVSLENGIFSWLTWWVGDVIGVLIFTPFFLCFMGEPRSYWRLRISSVALPLLFLLLLVVVLFQHGKHQEQLRINAIFEERTHALHVALQNKLKRQIEINQSLKAFFDSSKEVAPADFKLFTQRVFSGDQALQALEWIPRVTAENLDYYEQRLGPGFALRIRDDKQVMLPVPPCHEHFPVAYVEPYLGNERAFGFDITSNPMANVAIQKARDTGQTTVTQIIHLVQDLEKRPGAVIYSPVYQHNQPVLTQGQRRQFLLGYVASVLRIDNEVNEVKSRFKDLHVLLSITDEGMVLLNEAVSDATLMPGFQALENSRPLPFANHVWQVNYQAAPQFYQSQISWAIWWLILGGFILTSLTGIGLLMLTRRTMRTEGIVKQRTRELEGEMARRKEIIRQRNDHNKVLQAIASPTPLPEILTLIVNITEQNYPDSLCSILLLDKAGERLYVGAAPSFPDYYNQAVDGLVIGEGMGSCGTAAYRKERVIIEDIHTHPYWRDFAELAMRANLAACWSQPIFSSDQQVLGTMAIYHRTSYYPSPELLAEINELAQLASIAIERRRSEEKVTQLAFFDVLTLLPNRRLFMANLEKALSADNRHKVNGALIYLDLDHFKALNDSLGHDIGDELLVQVAHRLKQCVRDEDTVARLGGDEFVIFLSGRDVAQDFIMDHALTMAERVQTTLQVPYQLKELVHYVTPSIGITLVPQLAISSSELLKQADTAMYQAKKRGRNTISFYNEAMQRRADQRLMLERELREALVGQQFSLYYQPQFDNNYQLIGAEALLRWRHPEKGLISLAEFIPVAEETGLILFIGDWVMREACAQLTRWPGLPRLAVNISPKQFRQPKFNQKMAAILTEHEIARTRLTLDITESSLMGDFEETVEKLQGLQNLGVELSVGNFGTGYSSLTHLRLLPINQLKIDQSFVHNINAGRNEGVIVETIIVMAKHFGLSVIAEGVETKEQFQFLAERDCNGFQGYFFSMPLTVDEFGCNYFPSAK